MTDNEILCLMREAPPQGQRALFDKYYSYVYYIVNRIINGFGSADDSEECVIDVFASVMMKSLDNVSVNVAFTFFAISNPISLNALIIPSMLSD